jgi:hypothetical protein
MYATPEGFKGSPAAGMLEDALTTIGATDANLHP